VANGVAWLNGVTLTDDDHPGLAPTEFASRRSLASVTISTPRRPADQQLAELDFMAQIQCSCSFGEAWQRVVAGLEGGGGMPRDVSVVSESFFEDL